MLFHFIYQHATGILRGAYSFGTVEAPLMQCSEIHRAANRTTRRGTGYYCTVTVVYRSRSEEHCWLPLRYCNCKRTQLKRTVVRAMSCGCNSAANLLVQLHCMAFIVLATLNSWVDVRLAILLIITQYDEWNEGCNERSIHLCVKLLPLKNKSMN